MFFTNGILINYCSRVQQLNWLEGLILEFIINAVNTVFTSMCYAELGFALPDMGRGYYGLNVCLI
jgi:amino acid transporter